MSKEALEAYYRLRVRPRIDGTMNLVLYHLCMRHNSDVNAAWPSLKGMSADLDVADRTLSDAITKLANSGLITREKGGGRGKPTRYRLPFLRYHRAFPGIEVIEWDRGKRCGPPHPLLDQETVRSSVANSAVGRSETVRSTADENNKSIKTDQNLGIAGGNDLRRTLEARYGPYEKLGPADRAMFDRALAEQSIQTQEPNR